MKSQPRNPEFRINPENFQKCILTINQYFAGESKPIVTLGLSLVLLLYCSSSRGAGTDGLG